MVEEYRRRVTYAAQRINALPGMRVLEPQGTFYLFPCVKPAGLTSAQATELLAKAGVLVVPGPRLRRGGGRGLPAHLLHRAHGAAQGGL